MVDAVLELSEPVESMDDRLKAQALESDRCIRRESKRLSKASMEIGWEGAFLRRNNAWPLLGHEHENSYRAAVGIGRSTWYDVVKIASYFPQLDKETYLAMSLENARRLGMEPEAVRYDPKILQKATTQPAQEFKDELTTEGAHREGKPLSEHWKAMEWRFRQEQYEVIEQGLKDWQHEHGIDDLGYALELMIAECRERPTLVGFMTESIPRLTREVMTVHSGEDVELSDLRALRETFAVHLKEMGEILRICCGESCADGER